MSKLSNPGIQVGAKNIADDFEQDLFLEDQIRRIHEKRAKGLVSVFKITFDVFHLDSTGRRAECIRLGNVAGYVSTRSDAQTALLRYEWDKANIHLGVMKVYHYEEMIVTPEEKDRLLNE